MSSWPTFSDPKLEAEEPIEVALQPGRFLLLSLLHLQVAQLLAADRLAQLGALRPGPVLLLPLLPRAAGRRVLGRAARHGLARRSLKTRQNNGAFGFVKALFQQSYFF